MFTVGTQVSTASYPVRQVFLRQLHRRQVLVALVVVAALLGMAGCEDSKRTDPLSTASLGVDSPGVGSPRASTAATPVPSGATNGPATVTIVGSGDVLLHPDLWAQARRDAQSAGESGYDFRPLFGGVKKVIASADLAICHLETPLAPAAGPFAGFPSFEVPPQIVPALADLGYDSCSTASNHTLDGGEAGITRTLGALDQAKIAHAGSYRSARDHDTITMLDVHGVRVAHLSYTFGFNGLTRPTGKQWIANQIDTPTILAEAHRARAAGAAIVVVSLHFGTEYQHAPNAQQLSVAKALLSSPDVDLILGCHAHVVQPFEKIGDKWIAYGMGNEVAHHASPVNDNREGVLARFTFTRSPTGAWRVTTAEAIPVWMDLTPNNRLVDIGHDIADPATSAARRATLRSAWLRIQGYLVSRGADAAGLRIAAA